MATKHVKYVRCLVWQMALRHWKEFRTNLLAKIQLRIRRLHVLIIDLKRQYKLLKEPEIEMTKAYKVATYFHEIAGQAARRRMRKKSKYSVKEQQNVESIDKKQEYGLDTLIEYICTGEESQDEFEQQKSESNIGSAAPTAKGTGTDGLRQQSISSSAPTGKGTGTDELRQQTNGSSAPTAKGTGTDELRQQSSGSSAPTSKGTGTYELRQPSSGSQSALRSASSAPKEKYTGTKPKRLQIHGGELVSASNIQVPHAFENLKHDTAVLDLSLRRKEDADDEKIIKNGHKNYRKTDEFRDTGGYAKICTPTPPPRRKEPPPNRRLDDASDNGKVCRNKDDENDNGSTPPPRNEKEAAALNLSSKIHWLEAALDLSKKIPGLKVEPLPPELPELPGIKAEFDYAIGVLETFAHMHIKMELASKSDPTMRRNIEKALQEELQKHLDMHQFVIDGVEWVTLGKYNTKLKKKVLCGVDWTISGIEITRHLLMHIFDLETLETHNLTGEGNAQLAGDMPIAKMSKLDEQAVTDLGDFMFIMKGQMLRITRETIEDTCAELYKAKLERVKKERELKWQTHKPKKAKRSQRKYGRRK